MANDSKSHWLEVHKNIPAYDIRLGKATSNMYVSDPKMLSFVGARYKFVSKMLSGFDTVLEVGCGDGFGAPIVASAVKQLYCTDIDHNTLEDNASRLKIVNNLSFEYFDFRNGTFKAPVNGVFAVDVIEHIFPAEERQFLSNISNSLVHNGVGVFGTPNITSEQYASKYSRMGHVNLQGHQEMYVVFSEFFWNVFILSMNDEVVHTGYYPMAHYLFALCVTPKR
jgi:2-polyprenyl-3-methyl-5-hydroxy-6-metoxy-1,4-benzoquinol methylase